MAAFNFFNRNYVLTFSDSLIFPGPSIASPENKEKRLKFR